LLGGAEEVHDLVDEGVERHGVVRLLLAHQGGAHRRGTSSRTSTLVSASWMRRLSVKEWMADLVAL
jgi:hypothetical protein